MSQPELLDLFRGTGTFLYEYAGRDLSYEELEEILEREAEKEEADELNLPD
ncbi:MAG: hypothetical protein FWH03_02215 [Firmicutes bacterium]|nr:hypothetical protein [Bacillota bacterium]